MKEKKLIGYKSLKEACKVARERALEKDLYAHATVYIEKDGSYTVSPDNTKNSKFFVLVDKSGARYQEKWQRTGFGKRKVFIRIN